MWHLGTWFNSGFDNVRFTVGLDGLKGLFQPKLLYDSMTLSSVQNDDLNQVKKTDMNLSPTM